MRPVFIDHFAHGFVANVGIDFIQVIFLMWAYDIDIHIN